VSPHEIYKLKNTEENPSSTTKLTNFSVTQSSQQPFSRNINQSDKKFKSMFPGNENRSMISIGKAGNKLNADSDEL
jgi:hypothetical protein